MLRQRVYGLALGYEDLNDHETLRGDPGYQTVVGRDVELASSPTLCRLENRADQATTWAILSILVKAFRQRWPDVRIVFRGDSGFCRHRMMTWCERHDVHYIIGIAKNPRLTVMAEPYLAEAERRYEEQQSKQRLFTNLKYGAKTWSRERRVISKSEVTAKGRNPRFVVTNLPGDAQALYDDVYCARGDMENRIKDQQLGLIADRTSCHRWWPNQLRLLLSSLA